MARGPAASSPGPGSFHAMSTSTQANESQKSQAAQTSKPKLFGRAFYESIGSPKFILAPMVEQSEFAWRMLTRSFMTPELRSSLLAYTPMFHSRLFVEASPNYRNKQFQPTKNRIPSPPSPSDISPEKLYLDGNPSIDRPLFVQFCANDPDELLGAGKVVQLFCDAVDLNLGCPQGIARKGKYGAFLQEDWDLIYRMINKLHKELDIPITAKMRILETREKTLEYAKMILNAGASIITVHGRQRDQKGHNTGVADWAILRYLRENLPKETVIFANGNILQYEDIEKCLEETGADGVMSAEGNLYDPSIFAAPPPPGTQDREYWIGKNGKGGYRMDAVMRRYLDIIHRYTFGQESPQRSPLWIPSDPPETQSKNEEWNEEEKDEEADKPAKKKQKLSREQKKLSTKHNASPNLSAMQAHLFHFLRPLVSKCHDVRDALARCRTGDLEAYEGVLKLVEGAVKAGMKEYVEDEEKFEREALEAAMKKGKGKEKEKEKDEIAKAEEKAEAEVAAERNAKAKAEAEAKAEAAGKNKEDGKDNKEETKEENKDKEEDPLTSSYAAVKRCMRPWFICQPYVRPLPIEAFAKGSMQLSKKDRMKKLEGEMREKAIEEERKVKSGENGNGNEKKEEDGKEDNGVTEKDKKQFEENGIAVDRERDEVGGVSEKVVSG